MSSNQSELQGSQPSQSISIAGGQLANVQIGGQAGQDLTAVQTQFVGTEETVPLLAATKVAEQIDLIKVMIETSHLSTEEKEKAVRNLDNATDEVQSNEPDKGFATKSIKRATTVLKNANETVEAGTSLWKNVKPIVEAISPWLGVAASTLI